MKKKVLSALLATAMVATLLAGCGSQAAAPAAEPAAEPAATEEAAPAEAEEPAAEEAASGEGKVLNIYAWNEEFKSRLISHYPGYEEVDGTTGKIGDIDVKWNITPSENNAYQNNLDAALLKQADASADEKIDLFLVEADYALKYVDTDYTMNVLDLGLTDADLAEQYDYTKKIVTDSNGVLKGVSWQACPAIMFYNREIAKEVLGTDDPDAVQAEVKDWAAFKATADKMKDAGYQVCSSVNDTFRVYSNNVTSKWVDGNKINIDKNIENWVNDSKALVDAGEAGTHDLWGEDWSKGFFKDGKVFAYFGPAWFINFCMSCDQEGSVGIDGGWGPCVGPQSFFWGGTWICGATGTDNATLVADIMKTMTCNADVMKEIVQQDDDFANNKKAMAEMAASDYTSKVLGGVNPLPMYMEGAEKIDLSNLSAYDQGCNESFQNSMKDYFLGNATYEEALDNFYKSVIEKYPELTQ